MLGILVQIEFPSQFGGYTRIEYMSVFVSFLYALVISEFFMGWAKMIRNRAEVSFSFDHIIYSILFFWILLLNWWSLWIRMAYLDQGFVYFLLVIIPLAISYLGTVFLFPSLQKEKDLTAYFDQNFRMIGISLSLFILINSLVGIFLNESAESAINTFRLTIGSLILIAAVFNLKKWRKVLAALIAVLLLLGSVHYAFV